MKRQVSCNKKENTSAVMIGYLSDLASFSIMQELSLHERPMQPHCRCRHRQPTRRRASFTSCAVSIFTVATLSSAAVSILVSPHGNSMLAYAATPASASSISPYSSVESTTFIFSLLKRRKQQRLDKEQPTILLEEGGDTGGLIMDIPGRLHPRSFPEFGLVNDEPYASDIHPIDNAYDRLSETLGQGSAAETNGTICDDNIATSQDNFRQSLEATIDNKQSTSQTPDNSPISELEDTTTSWAKRNARSIDEGIRFKSQLRQGLEDQTKLHREQLLSDLMQGVIGGTNTTLDAKPDMTLMKRNVTNPIRLWWSERVGKRSNVEEDGNDATTAMPPGEQEGSIEDALATTTVDKANKKEFYSRTLSGLVMALAEEVEGLEVDVDVDENTPFWNKTFNSINVKFSRLGFRQMRLGGLDDALTELEENLKPSEKFSFARGLFNAGGKPTTADEAFDQIDIDNSGSLDEEELAQALKMAAILGGNTFGARSKQVVEDMASKLIRLYDSNGDGVVDREEYRVLVQDMSALRDARLREEYHQQLTEPQTRRRKWFRRRRNDDSDSDNISSEGSSTIDKTVIDITDDENFWESMEHGEGSIVFKDMKLDLRRLLFGLIPGMKRILPGGPLILQPFTATVTASWNREDILNSVLIDIGLRRLVARALSRRVRGIRDLFDGAVFYGRTWKNLERNAPQVEVQKLEDVQFDWRDRLIITGRAKIRASPDALSIENGFKLRTKIGTRGNGRIIGLLQPEIAIFAELPKEFENK